MTTLHILSTQSADICKTPFSIAGQDDAILLIGEAVYCLANTTTINTPAKIFVLAPDLQARGIDLGVAILDGGIDVIDYAGFVTLTEDNHPIVSWY